MKLSILTLGAVRALSFPDSKFYDYLTTREAYETSHRLGQPVYGTCNATQACIGGDFFECRDDECYHKNPFPIYGKEWGGYIVVTLLMGLCNVAGIGGGAID